MRVKEIMKKMKKARLTEVVVNSEESIDNAALLMKDHELDEITVVNSKGDILGIVTREALIEHSDELNEDFLLD